MAGAVRIGEKILGMFAAKPRDIANRAIRDQLARELAGGRADIVEARHADLTLGRRDHGAAVINGGTQRFFAKHGLVQGKGGLGDGAVKGLWGGDDDRLNPVVIDQGLPLTCGAGKAERAAIAFGTFGAAGADHFQTRAQGRVEHRPHSRHCDGMGFAHIPATNDTNTDFCHRVVLSLRMGLQPVAKAVSLDSKTRNHQLLC